MLVRLLVGGDGVHWWVKYKRQIKQSSRIIDTSMEDFQKSMHRYLESDNLVRPLLRLGGNDTKKVHTGETGHEHDNFGTERWFEFPCHRSSLLPLCVLYIL